MVQKRNITPFDQNRGIQKNWSQKINRKQRNRLPRILKITNQQKKESRGETIKEISRHVRPEWVNKWLNCVLVGDGDDDDDE